MYGFHFGLQEIIDVMMMFVDSHSREIIIHYKKFTIEFLLFSNCFLQEQKTIKSYSSISGVDDANYYDDDIFKFMMYNMILEDRKTLTKYYNRCSEKQAS